MTRIFTLPTRLRSRAVLISSLELDHSVFYCLKSNDPLYHASRIFDSPVLRMFLNKLENVEISTTIIAYIYQNVFVQFLEVQQSKFRASYAFKESRIFGMRL